MCNANNHPPGCSCGWGGVWYGGNADGGSWLFNKEPRPRMLGRQRGTYDNPSASLTIPNSKCPCCGESVFYYQSPYGGRVFFDDLGPPWPKHPCTSGDITQTVARKLQSWQKEGWRTLAAVLIEKSNTHSGVYVISGTSDQSQYKFCFTAEEIVMAEIVRYRPVKPRQFEVSILDYNTTNTDWLVWSGVLFTDEAEAATSAPLSKSVIHTHQNDRVHKVKSSYSEQTYLVQCPDCQSKLNPKKFLIHILRQHKYIPLGSMDKITGRLVVS